MIFDLIILDQVTKWVARIYWETPIEVFDFFSLRFVENEGIAFSLPVAQYIIVPFTILVMIWLGYQIYTIFNKQSKQDNKLLTIYAYALIFAGAVGNLIDRLIYGKVTDFLSFWDFPIFNLADSWITIGVCLFVLDEFLDSKKTP